MLMPANFLHPVFAYIINKWKPGFSLPALLVGSIIPDIEVIPIYFFTNGEIDRLIFHSIIGAMTLGTIVSIATVMFVYPRFVSLVFRIDIKDIRKKCRFSATLIGACIIGNLSHVLIDATSHEYNPLLYPIIGESVNVFRISSEVIFDRQVINLVLILLAIIILVLIRRGQNGFWKKLLVGY